MATTLNDVDVCRHTNTPPTPPPLHASDSKTGVDAF
jgi:hypothetical protein